MAVIGEVPKLMHSKFAKFPIFEIQERIEDLKMWSFDVCRRYEFHFTIEASISSTFVCGEPQLDCFTS